MGREASPTERAVFNLATAWQESEAKLAAAVARAEKAERERDAYAKAKAENDERFQIEAGKWKALYAQAWEEIQAYRQWGYAYASGTAHDAARKEAGLNAVRLCYPFSITTCDDPRCSCRRDKAADAAKPQE